MISRMFPRRSKLFTLGMLVTLLIYDVDGVVPVLSHQEVVQVPY